jgi:hypothetical protein
VAVLEFFTVQGNLSALIVDYVDVGAEPDVQKVSCTCEFRPRIGNGQLVWASGLSPKQGLALAPIKARFDTDGYLRTIQATSVNETQTVTSTLTSGTFPLTFSGQTATIAWNSTPPAMQAALEALSSIGVGNVSVGGPTGGPWPVTFAGALASTDVPLMTSTDTTHISIAVTKTGALNQGVQLVANTEAINLDQLLYDVVFTNVVYNKADQQIAPFAIEAPTTGGVTVDLADLPKLPPKAGL